MALTLHGGTTRLLVHCVLSDSSCLAPERSPRRGAGVGQPANLPEQTRTPRFVGCGSWYRLPDACKRAGRRCFLPMADKDGPPSMIGIGNRRTASCTIADAVF